MWIASAPVGYVVGQRKGRGVQGLVLGLLLGVVGLVVIVCLTSAQPSTPAAGAGTAAAAPRSYYAFESIAGYPLFIVVLSTIAVHAIPDPSGRVVGIVAGALALLLIRSALRANYVALVGPEGSVTFKSLVRSTTTAVSDIHRLAARSGYRGATMWYFVFEGGTAGLNGWAGRSLARYVISRNPSVSYPPAWDGRLGLSLRS